MPDLLTTIVDTFPADAPVVYLLHFDNKVGGHARHYMGYAKTPYSLCKRMHAHSRGTSASSSFCRAARAQGASFQLVRVWPGGRALERRLKGWHKHAALCPVCKAKRRQSDGTYRQMSLLECSLSRKELERMVHHRVSMQELKALAQEISSTECVTLAEATERSYHEMWEMVQVAAAWDARAQMEREQQWGGDTPPMAIVYPDSGLVLPGGRSGTQETGGGA